ncbi:MAG TPA: hypothetical protein VHL53_07605, partial [Acidimicrobiia bacterium]|nr:hypothetical protein [Acidimicrobiia bacterium]
MPDFRALGHFNERTIVGWFDPRIADVEPTRAKFGLNLQVQYFYGGLRDADGRLYVLERKFIGPMTSGLWLMTNRGAGHLRLAPQALRTARGEIRRQYTAEAHRYSDALMAKVGTGNAPEGEQPLDLSFTDGGISWAEGDLLALEATPVGTGLMWYSPMPDDSLLYSMQAYRASGTILGQAVTGFVHVDHGYWPAGREWKELRFFGGSQVAWNVFANEYEDGTVESGFFIAGLNDYAVAGTFDHKGPRFATSELGTALTLDGDGWAATGRYTAGGEEWVFTADPAARMEEFSAARWEGYRAQAGTTRRAGDTRPLKVGWTWLEFFADRARAGGFTAG